MKLREALVGKTRVKIGSGTAFVYCGPVDLKRIERHSAEELARLKAEKRRAARFISNYEEWEKRFVSTRVASRRKRQEKALKEGKTDVLIKTDIQLWNEAEAEAIRRLSVAERKQDDLDRRLARWTGFLNREVIDQYKSVIDPNVDIIIFEGDEEGDYCDEEEYEKANGVNRQEV